MKKLFIIFTCTMCIIAFLSSAQAISRSSKTSDSDKKKEAAEPKEVKEKRSWEVTRKTNLPADKTVDKDAPQRKFDTKSGEGKEEYDYFIDQNNNGIDDRLEGNVNVKEIRKPEIAEKKTPPTSEKTFPRVNSTAKTKERTKNQGTSDPKKKSGTVRIEKKSRSGDKRQE